MKKLYIDNNLPVVLYLKTKTTDCVTHKKIQLDFYDHEPDGFPDICYKSD